VGIAPDPMMFVALNCQDMAASKAFYNKLGFVVQVRYDYMRDEEQLRAVHEYLTMAFFLTF
jgi:predicted lactoylglutathione lyase